MCTLSAVSDNWRQALHERYPETIYTWPAELTPSRAEFDALKAEMVELKKLLQAAQVFDDATGQKDCESEEKVALIRRLAVMVGVDMGDLFGDRA